MEALPLEEEGPPLLGLARCARCGSMYDESEAESGCVRKRAHVRCEATSKALAGFPVLETGLRRRRGGDAAAAPPAAARGPPSGAEEYAVRLGDTAASLCLRFGMRRDELLRWNRLLTPNLYSGQKLWVRPPPPRDDEAASARRALVAGSGCSVGEAEYYLDESGGDRQSAMARLKEDRAWAQEAEARMA